MNTRLVDTGPLPFQTNRTNPVYQGGTWLVRQSSCVTKLTGVCMVRDFGCHLSRVVLDGPDSHSHRGVTLYVRDTSSSPTYDPSKVIRKTRIHTPCWSQPSNNLLRVSSKRDQESEGDFVKSWFPTKKTYSRKVRSDQILPLS